MGERGDEHNISEANSIFFKKRCQKVLTRWRVCGIILERFRFLGISRNFLASIGSFQGLPAEASEVILLPQRLALKYNTTPPPPCQHFLTDFFHSFLRAPQNSSRPQEKLRRSCNAAAAAKAEESSPGTIQVFRIFAGSARLQQPAWAAFRSGQWVPDPIHCNSCLPGSSKPQTALPPH